MNHTVLSMVLILDGNSEHVTTHERKKVFRIRNVQFVISLDQISDITSYVRTYFWVTI